MSEKLAVLLIDDEEIVHRTLGDYLQELGHDVFSSMSAADGLAVVRSSNFDLVITDIRMPGMDGLSLLQRMREMNSTISVVIITGHGNLDTAVQALRLGATDFLTKPVKLLELDAVLERVRRLRTLEKSNAVLEATVGHLSHGRSSTGNSEFLGVSEHARTVREQVAQIGQADCDTVLITGETGTGKEVVAHEVHRQFNEGKGPFIAISCPTIPPNLIESELFGSVKGSYTGASEDRQGLFQLADGGTLFLDEIADLSPSAQAAMLRVLETRRIRPVGGSREIPVDVRAIAASNTSLEDMTSDGSFRRDLLYRLNLFTIHLDPLRKRTEDVQVLASHFLERYRESRGLTSEGFTPSSLENLLSYDFPGNVRELRNLVERAAMLKTSGPVSLELNSGLQRPPLLSAPVTTPDHDDERSRLVEALERARWNRRQAAADLGMPYSTLRYKMQRLDIK